MCRFKTSGLVNDLKHIEHFRYCQIAQPPSYCIQLSSTTGSTYILGSV
jgi:hypothetical protein